MSVIFFLLLLPFCQTGVNYYASVPTLMMLLVLIRYGRQIFLGISRSLWLLPVAALFFLPAIFYSTDLLQDLLRAGRESLFLLILVGAIRGAEVERPQPMERRASLLLFGLVAALFALAAIQAVLYSRNIYFGLPKSLYIMGTGTIADEKNLAFSAGNLRPTATYSEPSYLGLVLLSLAMVIAPRAQTQRGKVMMAFIVITGLLSRSASFLLTGTLMLVIPAIVERRRAGANVRMAATAMVIALPVLLFTKAGMLFDRLSKAGSSPTGDFSAEMRLVGPLQAMPGYLSTYPIGLPFEQVLATLPQFYPAQILEKGFGSDNAFLNFFFLYGFLAIAPLTVIFFAGRDIRIKLFLFSCMMFNGGFLRVDITALTVFGVMNYLGGAASSARRTKAAPVQGRSRRALIAQRAP